MFTHDTKEKQTNQVDITDASPAAVGNMLDFIYHGKMTIDNADFEELLLLADKYQMYTLKTFCIVSIANYVSTENSGRLLKLASAINDHEMKRMIVIACTDKKQDIKTFLGIPGWRKGLGDTELEYLVSFKAEELGVPMKSKGKPRKKTIVK